MVICSSEKRKSAFRIVQLKILAGSVVLRINFNLRTYLMVYLEFRLTIIKYTTELEKVLFEIPGFTRNACEHVDCVLPICDTVEYLG